MARGTRTQQILIADNHLLFRRGLRALVAAEPDLAVVGEVSTLSEAIEATNTTAPDVVVMNVSLLEGASERETLDLRYAEITAPILFIGATDDASVIERAMAAGGRGYMLKSSTAAQLLAGIRRICWTDEREADSVSTSTADLRALADSSASYGRGASLTMREQEILKLLAEGRTVRETATELSLSMKTVEAHKLNLMRKLDIHNRATLIGYAVQKGIIEPAPAT